MTPSRRAAGTPRKRRVPGWMMRGGLFLIAGLGLLRGGAGGRRYSAGLSEREAEALFERGYGAQHRIQVLYHQLLGTGSVPVPAAIAAEQHAFPRVAMRDLGEDVTVGELWLDPAHALYEFLDIVRKGFPAAPYGGVEAPLPALAREHEENAVRCLRRLERLQQLDGGSRSFGGQGARLIEHYAQGCRAASFAGAAARADDPRRYREAVLVAARAMSDAAGVPGAAR